MNNCSFSLPNVWADQHWPAQTSKTTAAVTTNPLSRLRRTAKRFDRARLILLNIENGGQTGHLKQIMDPLIQIGEFQMPTLAANRGVSLDQFPDSGTVYVIDFAQIQHDRFVAFFGQISNHLAENDIPLSQRDSSADVNDGDSADLPDRGLHLHRGGALHSDSQAVQHSARG